jgi:hypothetical protein
MDDDGGFDFTLEGLLLGGLIGLLLGSQHQQRQTAQAQAAQQAQAEAVRLAQTEQAIVDRGWASYRAAQQFGMTPDLAADIADAEETIRRWQAREEARTLAHRLRHLRDAGRWASFLGWTLLWTLIGFIPVAFATDMALESWFGVSVAGRSGWLLLAVGAWPAAVAIAIAVHLDDAARQQIPEHLSSRLHRHDRRWHAHDGAYRYHCHLGDPDGPAIPC